MTVRRDVALRLLDSVEVVDQDSVDDAWAAEIWSPTSTGYDEREYVAGEQFEVAVCGAIDATVDAPRQGRNETGRAQVRTTLPLLVDDYAKNPDHGVDARPRKRCFRSHSHFSGPPP